MQCVKDTNHMNILIFAKKKALNKIQHTFMIKMMSIN